MREDDYRRGDFEAGFQTCRERAEEIDYIEYWSTSGGTGDGSLTRNGGAWSEHFVEGVGDDIEHFIEWMKNPFPVSLDTCGGKVVFKNMDTVVFNPQSANPVFVTIYKRPFIMPPKIFTDEEIKAEEQRRMEHLKSVNTMLQNIYRRKSQPKL